MVQVFTTDTSWIHEKWSPDEWDDGWSLDEWNDDWNCVGWHEDCEQEHDTSASSFSLESTEWAKMNLDTGVAVNTFPSNFGPEGKGDGNLYDRIPDGEAWPFQRYEENGLHRCLNGRLKDGHEVLGNIASASASAPASGAAGIACKEPTRRLRETQWWLHISDPAKLVRQ